MKIRTARRIAQVFFFSLFLFFVFVTDLRYLKGYPVSLFLELDPLVAFATAITTHTIYMGLLWSLLLILPTLLFGRIFCNWICPYGILHHFTGWLLGKRRAEERERIEVQPLPEIVFAQIRHPHRDDRRRRRRHACKSAGSTPSACSIAR